MFKRRFVLLTSLLLIGVIALSGCAARPGAGTTAAQATQPNQLLIDLPSIVVDINSDGSPSIGNVPVSQIGAMAGMDLSSLAVPKAWVDYMVNGNIQNMSVNIRPDGLMLLVNGEPIPSVQWDGQSLTTTAEAMKAFGVAIPMAEKILPLAQSLGLGVVVRFPVAPGQAAIPLYVEGENTAAATAKKAQDEFLQSVGAPAKINLPIVYNADGSFTVGDLTDAEWSALTGAPVYALRLNPTLIDNLSKMGVKSLTLSTDTAGIHMDLNGQPLPTITWENGELLHLMNVADSLGLWNMVAPGMDVSSLMATVQQLLPVVQTTDLTLHVELPSGVASVQ